MKKGRLYYKCITSFLLLFSLLSVTHYAMSETVLVTGEIVDNSKYSWTPAFIFLNPQGDEIKVNIDPYQSPARGQFIIPVEIGVDYQVALITALGNPPFQKICIFNVKADSETHATMQLVSAEKNNQVLCHYSGDPNQNNANITISDNTSRLEK